jgi:hypothetical protein
MSRVTKVTATNKMDRNKTSVKQIPPRGVRKTEYPPAITANSSRAARRKYFLNNFKKRSL